MGRLTLEALQAKVGAHVDGEWGPKTAAKVRAAFTNPFAERLTDEHICEAAGELGVSKSIIYAVRKVEAPRGAFDTMGRVACLYERHVFARNSHARFNRSHAEISGKPYGPGGYGPFSAQYDRLLFACSLDPDAAFRACSWGAFQVLGENAEALGYASAFDMVVELAKGEREHLDSFVRFVKSKGLVKALQHCKAGDPDSCIPFVQRYNGSGFRTFNYHVKLAEAAR